MNELKKIFGNTIGNALIRCKIYDIHELKKVVDDGNLWCVRGIGVKRIKIIEDYFKNIEEFK